MLARLRSWWQKTSKTLDAVVILILVVLIALVVVIILAYIFKVNIPGLSGKNLWDWLQLLIIPAVLAVGGYVFTYTTSRNDRAATEKRTQAERDIAFDNQRETALQGYIDRMSELIIEKKLQDSKPEDEVRKIARVRTLTVLPRLDKDRKARVLQFLHESGLIAKDRKIIELDGANLRFANLREANLSGADLSGADLSGADLNDANLHSANLHSANLHSADLSYADLSYANLHSANLNSANLNHAILHSADLSYADLYFASLSSYLSDASLSCADLRYADLSGANLIDADLSGANLSGANLTGATGITIEELE